MRRTVIVLAAALAAALPVQAQMLPVEIAARDSTQRLSPSSPWNLDVSENKCRLQRVFESDGKPHALIIEQSAPSSGFSLVLAGPTMLRFKGVNQLALGLSAALPLNPEQRGLSGSLPDYGPAFIFPGVSLVPVRPEDRAAGEPLQSAQIALDEADKVNRIVLANAKGNKAVSFETGNMRTAVAALNTCTAELLSLWGLDPEQHRAYRQPRLLNGQALSDYFVRTYPDRAVAKDEGGLFVMRLIVEPDGSVSGCHVEANSNVTEIDPRCAEIIKIAKMEPARDANGNPMRSFYITRMTFLPS